MSAPQPRQPGDQVTIAVRLRPRLAAFVHVLAEETGVSEAEMIAALLDDLAKRGATAHAKRHAVVIRRRQPATNLVSKQ